MDFKFLSKNLLITFHPVTLEKDTSAYQLDQLLAALNQLQDTGLVFTMPNADTDGRIMFEKMGFYNKVKNEQIFDNYQDCIKLLKK